jgi:hypothetical protein
MVSKNFKGKINLELNEHRVKLRESENRRIYLPEIRVLQKTEKVT